MALGLLGLLLITFFLILDLSIRAFQRSLVRHNIQADTQRISYRLAEDLRRTHFFTVSNVELKSFGGNFDRHTLCLAGIRDWSKASAIDAVTSRPRWERYILYYCRRQNGDEPVTRLFRCWLQPNNPSDMGNFAFPTLNPSVHCRPDPNSVAEIESFSLLSDIVENFHTIPLENSQWQVKFRLRQVRARKEATRWVDEVMETTIQVRPENTFPLYY